MRSPADALEHLRAMPCAARLARAVEPDEPVRLVGGAVRDLLLGRLPRELDVVVDGAIEPLARRLGGSATAHERFETARVLASGCAYDLARARRETYERPGALPDVRPATLAEDLRRRDFTVNAIALGLDGTLDAVDGALDDLEAEIMRVLHEHSFADDPTRVWRLARYATRLGFAIDPATRALASGADPATVSGPRHGAELRLTLGEPDPPAVLALLRELAPAFLPAALDVAPRALRPAIALLPADGRAELLTLAAMTAPLDVRELLGWLDGLGFSAPERDTIAAASRWSTGAPLRAAASASQIARAARGAPVEAVALAGGDNARRWIDELRHVRLEIDGHDLLAAGVGEGPELGERLARTLERKLDGELSGRADELAAALDEVRSR